MRHMFVGLLKPFVTKSNVNQEDLKKQGWLNLSVRHRK